MVNFLCEHVPVGGNKNVVSAYLLIKLIRTQTLHIIHHSQFMYAFYTCLTFAVTTRGNIDNRSIKEYNYCVKCVRTVEND